MRQFAGELASSGDAGQVAGRHARWRLGQAARIQRLLAGPDETEVAPDQEHGGLDDHQALEYMRRVLDQLAGDRSQA